MGFDDCAGLGFSHWLEGIRVRCRRVAREALLGAMHRSRAAGDFTRVHETAEVLYAVDPLSDAAAHALAERALARGDEIEAIRIIRTCLSRTKDELGVPGPAGLRSLLHRIEAVGRRVAAFSADAVDSGKNETTGDLLGRCTELAAMESLWHSAAPGTLATCLVRGPAGIGKSSLLRAFAASITARGAPVLIVNCQEIAQGIPFAAVAGLITELARESALGGTDPIWLAEASRVNPGLRSSYPGIPDPSDGPLESSRVRLAEAVFHMLVAVSDGDPMLVGFDDAQNIDPVSADVLPHSGSASNFRYSPATSSSPRTP